MIFFQFSSPSYSRDAPAVVDIKVWAVPAEQKVRPKDKPETTNLVWSGVKKQITGEGAGNEHVSFQVVITALVPEGCRPKALAYPGP